MGWQLEKKGGYLDNYSQWKDALLERFRDEANIDILWIQLDILKTKPD